LGGLEQHVRGDGEPERLGRLQIDREVELAGLLDGQVGGLGALQDAIHVVGGAGYPTAVPAPSTATSLSGYIVSAHLPRGALGRNCGPAEPPGKFWPTGKSVTGGARIRRVSHCRKDWGPADMTTQVCAASSAQYN